MFQDPNLTRYLFVLKIMNFLHKGLMKAITLLADIVNNSKTETIMTISKTQYTINDLCFEAFKFYDNVGVKNVYARIR